MDLIERYVQDTARWIPRNQRDDVVRELRSSLEDSLEDRAQVPLEQVDEELAVELLREFGKPQEVAASYRTGPDHLVGPAHYVGFTRTLKISLAVVGGLIALNTLIDVVGSSGEMGELVRIGARFITSIQTGFLALFGLVVLIYAVIERNAGPQKAPQEEWDPRDLPAVTEDADQVDRNGTIVGSALSAIALILINIYPEWLRVHVFSGGEQFTVPLLGSVLRAEVFIFNVYLVFGLVLGAVLLVQRRWRLETRIADAGVSAVLVLFLSRLWSKADLLLPGLGDLLDAGWPSEQAASFAEVSDEVLTPLLWWLLLGGCLVAAWVSIRKIAAVIRTARDQRSGPER